MTHKYNDCKDLVFLKKNESICGNALIYRLDDCEETRIFYCSFSYINEFENSDYTGKHFLQWKQFVKDNSSVLDL